MAFKGKDMVVEISNDQINYYTVKLLNDASVSIDADNQEISVFDYDFMDRVQGLKDTSWSLSGFYDPSDINGQLRIRQTWLNDVPLWMRILPNGFNGIEQMVKVASFEVSASVDSTQDLSLDLEGSQAITII